MLHDHHNALSLHNTLVDDEHPIKHIRGYIIDVKMKRSNGATVETETRPLSKKEVDESNHTITDYVDLRQLPKFEELRDEVKKVIAASSWFDLYGVDLFIYTVAVLGWFGSHLLLASPSVPVFLAGIISLGYCHYTLTFKAGHCAIHNSFSQSKTVNRLAAFLMSDFFGSFSTDVGYNIHIKCHHPHTNIIGLGDSSVWRIPFVPCYLYMFITPLIIPILTPLVSIQKAFALSFGIAIRHILIGTAGICWHFYLLSTVSQLSFMTSLLVVFLSRNVLSIPYIHVNIFQHIGLPMYSQKSRPKRIYQMLSGVLNLPRNPLLDYCFGHGIINCHVEHHLFPELSDNMCLKVKPVVSKFCKDNGLPYHYDTYVSRTRYFVNEYQRLMVNVPPITSFVGLQ